MGAAWETRETDTRLTGSPACGQLPRPLYEEVMPGSLVATPFCSQVGGESGHPLESQRPLTGLTDKRLWPWGELSSSGCPQCMRLVSCWADLAKGLTSSRLSIHLCGWQVFPVDLDTRLVSSAESQADSHPPASASRVQG